ncbi:phage baseplate protein [Megamonas funiformis]|uniref:phage baseplate protein n=2 Tax=Megamonas funiformis TaxID=437897 RepID=UPI0022E4443C|nr:phage tail protein [Megamonas funiformis]
MNSLQNRSTLLDKQYDTGQFSACIVTNIGKEMIAKSQNGQTLTFTRVALGDGLIDDDDDILSFTKVKNERLSANIAKWVDKQNGQFQIQFRVSNQEVEIGFWQREIGIMAKIDGGEEQLYAYATSGNGADFLYDKTTPIDERIVNIDFVIGNAENVQVIVNGSIIYATIEDLENAIDEHNDDENAHDNLIKKLFDLSEVTLESIKSKIKDWSKEVCLPLSGGTMKGNINANGYNITATKFIGNLQGKADSATKANQDKNGKDITGYLYKTEDLTLNSNAEILTVGNISEILNSFCTKFKNIQGTASYGENSPTSIKSLNDNKAPKTSPAFNGTPTAPTPGVDTNNTQLATCGFVRNAIAKYAPMLDTMKKIYPVGSIYMSTVSTNPATLFGFGTWEAMPAGRVLLAQGKSSWGTTYNAGSTGGEATHQLTVGEIPSHNHTGSINTAGEHTHSLTLKALWGDGNGSGNGWAGDTRDGGSRTNTFSTVGNHTHTVTINSTGSSQPHNNLQPYISVYMWKRST